MQVALIMVGGALGTLFRYKIGGWVQGWGGGRFPVGTFSINVSGALVAGFLATYLLERSTLSSDLRTAILVGLLGGYTTFSAFTVETLNLANDGEWAYAAANVLGSAAAGLVAVWAGQSLARL